MPNVRPFSRREGFTLIELLIVITVIGIVAGIAIPTYHSSVRKANEAAAVTTLNAIKVAQAKYVVDHQSRYGTFRELFEEGYLDKRFNYEQPHIRGYVFTISLGHKTEAGSNVRGERGPGTVARSYCDRPQLLLYRSGEWDLF